MKKTRILKPLVLLLMAFSFQATILAQTTIPDVPTDTIVTTLCPNQLPLTIGEDTFSSPGDYLIGTVVEESRDTSYTLFRVRLYPQLVDTIRQAVCANMFPYAYSENIQFIGATTFTTSNYENDENGCPVSTTFVITENPVYSDTLNVDICVVDTPYVIADTQFTQSGNYMVSLSSINGCDSIIHLNLNVHPTFHVNDTIITTVCSHDLPYLCGDSAFTETGIYDFPLNSSYGCDSAFIHLNLTVLQTQYDTLTFSLCSNEFPYESPMGQMYTEPGTYYLPHDDANICHSVTLLVLESHPAYNDTLIVDICDVDTPYVFGDTSFVESTIYNILDTTTFGCDSNFTLILNVHPTYQFEDTIDLNLCSAQIPYTYADTVIQTAGTYILDIKTTAGCDSTHQTLNVTISDNPVDTVRLGVCALDFPLQYGGISIEGSGEFDVLVPDTVNFGCDTLRHLVVDSLPIFHDSVTVYICENDSYAIGDTLLTEVGVHDIMLTSMAGCDSLITVTLNHYPVYWADTLSYTVCENTLPFQYADSLLNTEGVHLINIPTVNGCDSIIPIDLHILPIIYNADTIRREICTNQLPVVEFGRTLTEAGLYTYTVSSEVTGCDSVFYLRLIVHENPAPTIVGNNYICDGSISNLSVVPEYDNYVWNTGATSQMINISLPGTYTVTATNEFGCTGATAISVSGATLPNVQISGTQVICAGQSSTLTVEGGVSYVWEDGRTSSTIEVYPTQTTTYHVTVSNATPCYREGSYTVVVNALPTPIITGDNTVCQGDSTELIAGGGQTYLWSTGASGNRISVHSAGIYSVTVTDENGCRNSASQTLVVNSRPNIRINGRTQFCLGGNTMITATGAVSYEWSSGETTSSITTSYAGAYTVTGTAANGCSATSTVQLTTSQVNATIIGERHFCQGQSTTLTVTGNEPYHYRWADGTTTASVEVSTAGQYSVSVTNDFGCSNTITATVTEYALPNPSISGVTTICEGRSSILRATGGISYIWDDGSTNAYISVTTTGTYTVTATNAYGCSSSASETVIVNPRPEINILSENSICNGETVSIYAVSPTGINFAWTSGQTTALIQASPSNTTTYTVLVTDENNCSNTASTTIVVNPLPVPFINGETSFCQGNHTVLIATGGNNYQWSNGTIGNSISVTNGGTYTVTASNNSGCSATASANVTAISLPTVMVTDNVSICQGQNATLTASSTSSCTYSWSNGSYDNSISVSNSGNYNVTITNASGCSVTRSINVTVHNNPQITLVGTTTICEGQSTQIAAYGNENCTFSWSSGVNNSVATFFESGIYTVSATNNYGCTNTASTSIVVHAKPVPTISGDLTICPNGSTILSVSNGTSYRWSTGSTLSSITVQPSTPTAYSVTVTDAYGCQGNTSCLVQIGTLPNANISGSTSICAGQSTQLSVGTGYASYLWSNNSTSPSIVTNTAGTYRVTVTNALGCVATDSIEVTVNELPQLTFGMQHSICAGQSYTYSLPNDPNITYSWSNNATGNEITVHNPGIYTVTVTNQYGCSRSASDSLSVHPLPAPVITGTNSICRGSSTILTASGGTSYVWSNGVTSSDIAVFPVTQTTYTVTATNQYGCSAATSTTVSVKVLPSVNFSGDNQICPGNATTITANGGVNYLWSTGTSNNSITINEPGTYFVTVTNSVGCQRSDSIRISLFDNPVVSISGNSPICQGTSENLTAEGCYTYRWSTNENGSIISILPTATTTYTVTGTDIHGCTATATKTIQVEALPDVHIAGTLTICQGDTTTLTASGGQSYMWNNGSTASSIRANEEGNYTVIATSANGCSANETVHLTVNQRPIANIIGASVLCNNQTTVLRATGGDIYHWNNGAIGDTLLITIGGLYTVTVSNEHQCSSTATISVATLDAPFVQIVGTNNICDGSTANLFASSNAQNFRWNTGEYSQNITVSPNVTTDYIVTVSSNNGCSASDTMHLVVNPIYNHGLSATICQGNPYTQNGFNLPVQDEPGIHTYTNNLQTIHGCDSIITLTLTVNPLPVMPDTITGNPRIGNYGSYLYSVNGATDVITYEWRITNTHWGLTDNHINSAFLQIGQNGNGTLVARGINNCGFDEVSLSIYCNVSVDEYTNETQILLYPNPANSVLNINLDDAVVTVANVQLYDNLGRCLQTIPVYGNQMQLDCTSYAAGNYYVKFTDAMGQTIDTRKIIIRK